MMIPDDDSKSKPSSDNSSLYISAFVREFMAVGLLLVFESRIRNYDYMNSAIVLFLILITVRLPYINSYAYMFETVSMPSWAEIKAHGLKNDAKRSFKLPFFITILLAHIAGAIAAAAARVYFDVQYGTEVWMGSNATVIHQGLKVDVEALTQYSSTWLAGDRTKCFEDAGITGSKTFFFPVDSDSCITSSMRYVWFIGEEAAYVFLLCVCFIHIWLGSGVTSEKINTKAPPNPLSPEYWMRLFKISLLLTVINAALLRAFPTAHGSLHTTIYMYVYQEWGVNVRLIDTDNSEMTMRIVGGFVGVAIGWMYNSSLVRTFSSDADASCYKMWWGFDPPPKAPEYGGQFNSGRQGMPSAPYDQGASFTEMEANCNCKLTHGNRPSFTGTQAQYSPAATQLRIPYSLSAS